MCNNWNTAVNWIIYSYQNFLDGKKGASVVRLGPRVLNTFMLTLFLLLNRSACKHFEFSFSGCHMGPRNRKANWTHIVWSQTVDYMLSLETFTSVSGEFNFRLLCRAFENFTVYSCSSETELGAWPSG